MLPDSSNPTKWFSMVMMLNIALVLCGQDQTSLTGLTDTAALEKKIAPAISGLVSRQKPETSEQPVQSQNGTGEVQAASSQSRKVSYKLMPDSSQDLSQYKAVEVVATGYYSGIESTGKNPGHPDYGITKSGIKVRRDEHSLSTIAADPKVFPIGTVLYIPGYGYGIVADTGGAIKGKKIDLYYETKDQIYKEWGKKTVNVFVVKEGTGKVTQMIWNQLVQEIFKNNPVDTPEA
ncbi:3D domain-containing protein [Paenibacillus sp. 1P03SA]|uniref:3D domain-containing protein n=1 Tax=Paenibacillus sp. 1P03SA TaxID=3132294 RepID=UPI00399F6C26